MRVNLIPPQNYTKTEHLSFTATGNIVDRKSRGFEIVISNFQFDIWVTEMGETVVQRRDLQCIWNGYRIPKQAHLNAFLESQLHSHAQKQTSFKIRGQFSLDKFSAVHSTHYISYQSYSYIYFCYLFYATYVFCQYAECRCHLDRPMLFCCSESFQMVLWHRKASQTLYV